MVEETVKKNFINYIQNILNKYMFKEYRGYYDINCK